MTLEPDGQATGCNPVQVGSTPTGVFAVAPIDRLCGRCTRKEHSVDVAARAFRGMVQEQVTDPGDKGP